MYKQCVNLRKIKIVFPFLYLYELLGKLCGVMSSKDT